MKQLKTIALAIPLLLWGCITSAQDNMTRNIDIRYFKDIEISENFTVTLEQADYYSLRISYPAKYDRNVVAKVENGTLKIGFNRLFNYSGERPTAYITAPSFEELELDNIVTVDMTGQFTGHEMSIDLEGSSKLYGLDATAHEVSVNLSGTSSLYNARIEATSFEGDFSGMTEYDLLVFCDHAEMEAEGKSKGKCFIQTNSLELEASGMSKMNIEAPEGHLARNFRLNVSGKSKIDALYFPAEQIHAQTSGMSHGTVQPIDRLSARCTGLSTLKYVNGCILDPNSFVSSTSKLLEVNL